MKLFLLLLGIGISSLSQAQGECQMVYVSHHFVLNTTADTVTILVNNKDQVNYRTKEPEQFKIAPNERVEVSDLGWAEEFRDPTGWYVFKVETEGLTRLCDSKNWVFEKLSETQGEYSLTLKPTDDGKCVMDKNSLLSEELMPVPDLEAVEIEDVIYDFSNPEAEFPGGPVALRRWMNNNIQYSEKVKEDKTFGKVYVQFIVEKNGELTNIIVLRSPYDALSAEAIRLVKLMPNWNPGMINGEAERVRYNLPIVFKGT